MDLRIKKKDQAVNTRLGMGFLLALVGFAFCYAIYGWFIDRYFFGLNVAGMDVTWGHVLGIIVGLGYLALMLWLLLIKESSVDFLIKVDREIKKVTWPAWEQLKNSVYVVIGVIIFFGVVVFLYDMIFSFGIWKGLLRFK